MISFHSSVEGWSPYEDETVYDRKPVISWLVAPGNSKVIAHKMLLDGKKVEAQFDEARNLIFYKPDKDLSLGSQTLYAKVSFDDGNTC